MSQELYKRYRPKTLAQLVGQPAAVQSIEKLMARKTVPHAMLLTGPSGVGKTTVARILARSLECSRGDFVEQNCADFKGIEDVREIRRSMQLAPLGGKCRIWLIDEAHKLTNDAQNALLKMLEDTPSHVYFMLATTDPQKLINTIHTRCSQIKLAALDSSALVKLLESVIKAEDMSVKGRVVEEIIDACGGSARKALVILEQVGYLDGEKEQVAAIQSTTGNKDDAILLARELINPQASWSQCAKILKSIEGQEAESLRYMVLGYARAVMLGGKQLAPRAWRIIDIFSGNFYDSKHAGLAAACWEVIHDN